MWTPKRIGLLVLGFSLFVSAYVVYAGSPLGRIDGLSPLPSDFLPDPDRQPDPPPPEREKEVDRKLRIAFGPESPELKRSIRLLVREKGMALAAGDCVPTKTDGRVRLAPVSVALFGKAAGPNGEPEINTIRCREAYLAFERPVRSPADMNRNRVVGGELYGDIILVNNRRTPQRDDDISLSTQGPLKYEEARHLIWTENVVELIDLQSRPAPTRINATGMELHLATEATGPQPKPPKKPKGKTENVSGIERVVLREGVEMHLYVDARSGFLAAGKREPVKPAAPTPATGDPATLPKPIAAPVPPQAEKAHVVITTPGSFSYDLTKDQARFDVKEQASQFPDPVLVKRLHEPLAAGKVDQLDCEHLELQFRRKANNDTKGERGVELEIESVLATGRQLTLTSDAEMLVAHGNELYYEAKTKQTTLRGDREMVALKEGNEIHARELRILDQKGGQQATAIGPGQIDLLDKETGKRTRHARWTDKLVTSRDGNFDLLTLTGQAAFVDEEHGQRLQAECIKVWLLPAEKDKPGSAPAVQNGRREHHLEATGSVIAVSKDMNVHDTDRLVVWFTDAAADKKEAAADHPTDKPPAPALTVPPLPAPLPSPAKKNEEPAKAQKPIRLRAHLVEAFVSRNGAKSELEQLRTEGNVYVRQDPSAPEDKGVEIKGDTLKLHRSVNGSILVVTGADALAEVHLNKISIIGLQVNVDQTTNKAWVNGSGAMRLESNKDFQGRDLKRAVPLTIYWKDDMFFTGKAAEFQGNIQAEQENARLSCQKLEVTLDKAISLKEGDRGAAPAKVQYLACDKSVHVEDSVRGPDNKLLRYQRLDTPLLRVDNEEGRVDASGPGVLRLLQPGGSEAEPKRPPTAKASAALYLTRVNYVGRMWANNKTQTAIFYDEVDVIYLPAEGPEVAVDIDHLPAGALYLHCDKTLEVYSGPENGRTRNQQLKARGRVLVKSQDFFGRAEEVTYNEAKDQVIFDGGDGLATLYKIEAPGAPPKEIKGKKILYLRKTGEFSLIEGVGISVK